MSIRLNKAIRELNIGLQTAVEFLEKKPNLGEVKGDPNFKLSDAQYEALATQFNKDKQVKAIADKKFPKKSKEGGKKKQSQGGVKRGDDGLTKIQAYTPLGKIDLDQLNRKPGQKTDQKPKADQPKAKEEKPVRKQEPQQPKQEQPKPAQKEAAPQHKAEPKAEKPAVKEQPKETAHKEVAQKPAAQKENTQKENKEQAKPAAKAVETEQKPAKPAKSEKPQPAAAAQTETAQKEGKEQEPATTEGGAPFQTQNEKKLLNQPKLNVLGKLDLSTINQNTRPKKKSKEERRKEREEKNGQGKKKRVRINKERVDINAAANQQPAQQGKKQGQAQQQGQADGGGKRKKKNRGRSNKPLEVDDEAVARQVKETLARLTSKTQNKKGAKYRKEKRDAAQEKLNQEARAERKQSKTLKLTEFVTVSELATMMDVPVTKVISTLMSVGIMVSINQRLDAETINLVADEFGFSTEYVSAEVQEAVSEEADDENDLVPRAPIVTVMGHVDHGKTSLLDHIRNTNVIAGEAGGITQHIGAYSVTLKNGSKVTFLDTPGHEAFTAMRARGAQVTDIAIIIIAADDSVMPTTKEAIAHAQAAGVPMVFAINKIDKPGANPDKIREDLANMNLLVEEWGGKYQCQEISAKKGIGVDELMDKVLLEADLLELKANPNRKATGTVIESSLDKGRGFVSTVLVSNGTLKTGDIVIAGTSWGKVKALFNERNQRIEKAGPADPCIVLGLNGAPTAGDTFHVLETEQEAREIANKREQLQREPRGSARRSASRWETFPTASLAESSTSSTSSSRATPTDRWRHWPTPSSSSRRRRCRSTSSARPWDRSPRTTSCSPRLPMPSSSASRCARLPTRANWLTAKAWKSTPTPSSTMRSTTSRVPWSACSTRSRRRSSRARWRCARSSRSARWAPWPVVSSPKARCTTRTRHTSSATVSSSTPPPSARSSATRTTPRRWQRVLSVVSRSSTTTTSRRETSWRPSPRSRWSRSSKPTAGTQRPWLLPTARPSAAACPLPY